MKIEVQQQPTGITSSSSNSATKMASSSSSMTTSKSTSNTGDTSISRVPLTMRDVFFRDPFFESAWEDFEKIRQQMMKESEEFWQKVQRDNKALFEQQQQQIQQQQQQMQQQQQHMSASNFASSNSDRRLHGLFDSSDLSPWMFPRRWMLPRMFEDNNIFPSEMFSGFPDRLDDSNVIRMKDDDTKFEISLDTHGYRPDELKVNVAGNTLSVEAKHEEKGENRFVSRQFSRKYTLPEGCEPHKVVSNLSSDGILMISAPKKQALKADGVGRKVPIEMKR